MGYSCLAVNHRAEKEIIKILQESRGNPGNGSNTWGGTHFFECGRENSDGAITGTVYCAIPGMENRCRKAGSVRIDDGKIIRWPGTTKEQRQLAERRAAETDPYVGNW